MFQRLGKKDFIEDNELIDSDEQQRITTALINEAKTTSRKTRRYFSWLFNFIAALFVIVLAYSSVYPMDMSHQKVFKGIIPHYAFQVYYSLTIMAFYGASAYVKGSSVITGLSIGSSSGLVLAIIAIGCTLAWSYIFYIHKVTNVILYWLPTANILGFALSVYVDLDMADLVRQAEGVEKYKYKYRAL